MRRIFVVLMLAVALTSCNQQAKQAAKTEAGSAVNCSTDTVPKVTGIGGIFFFSDNPAETKAWYNQNLGLEVDDYGAVFELRNANNPNDINYLRWGLFKTGSEYFSPSKKEFMVNYRVQNIEGLVRRLRESGATVLDSIATYDYGKFVHILDPDGNKLELWEPIDSVLTALGGKTNK